MEGNSYRQKTTRISFKSFLYENPQELKISGDAERYRRCQIIAEDELLRNADGHGDA